MLQGKKILLVEDNEISRELVLEWLHSAGLETDYAVNGKKALDYLADNLPDAVLMDIQMPEMDGLEASRQLRQESRFNRLPVIAMTAHALKGDREKCLAAGMDDYIVKSIDPDKLFSTLAKWIGTTTVSPEVASLTALDNHAAQPDNEKQLELPGIDVEMGLFRASHNRKLYEKLLKTFARDFAGAEAEIVHCLSGNDIETPRRTVHSIKGVAANLGAEPLSAAAASVETSLSLQVKTVPEDTWNHFCWQLNQVISGINACFLVEKSGKDIDKQSPKGEDDNRVDRAVLLKQLSRIEALFDDDLKAVHLQIEAVGSDLKKVVDEELCQHLMDHIDDFELDEAAKIIKMISQVLRGGMKTDES
ncbi:MAG: response regulator [Pseudomonadota bacterium]|nr:response regulator [Pseudomonadota bacterium]